MKGIAKQIKQYGIYTFIAENVEQTDIRETIMIMVDIMVTMLSEHQYKEMQDRLIAKLEEEEKE